MKTRIKICLLALVSFLMISPVATIDAMAANQDDGYVTIAAKKNKDKDEKAEDMKKVETNLFGTVEDDGSGCGVYTVLNLILTILTYGVGIAATVGLVISAITYLTAGDDTGNTAKAKTRIFEIVIGLLLYAMMWAALNWLLPGGLLNTGSTC